jgi:hypothetical protein
MDAKEMQVMNRLLKKLSALRATLPDEERALLDEFIVTPKTGEDVQAHVFQAPITAAEEVQAHVMPPQAMPPAEVLAHAMPPQAMPPAEVLAHAMPPQRRWDIIYDAAKQAYKIQ